MDDKQLFGAVVNCVADDISVTAVSVRDIVNAFISECRDILGSGVVLRIGDLVTIYPSVQTSQYVPTLGFLANKVAKVTGKTYYTVYAVIEGYLNTLKKEILSGRSADIRKIVSFHSISLGNGKFKVNCALSASLRDDLREGALPKTARVSFNKSLRSAIKEVVL